MLDDECEIDGACFGGSIRQANEKDDRIDCRRSRHQTGKRRVVIALRERGGRTLTSVAKREAKGVAFARERVEADTTINTGEAPHWDILNDFFPTERINHSEAYSLDGVHTNYVESYFSRLSRMVCGQQTHVSPQYLHQLQRTLHGRKITAGRRMARWLAASFATP